MAIPAAKELSIQLATIREDETIPCGTSPLMPADKVLGQIEEPVLRRLSVLAYKARRQAEFLLGQLRGKTTTAGQYQAIMTRLDVAYLAALMMEMTLHMKYGYDKELAVRDGFTVVETSPEMERALSRAIAQAKHMIPKSAS